MPRQTRSHFVKQDKTGQEERTPARARQYPDHIRRGGGKNKQESLPEAKFSDVTVGRRIAISISADHKFITGITIEGRTIYGSVAAVDVAKGSITVSTKGEGGVHEETFVTSGPATSISVSDANNKGQAATLAEVSVGMSVNIQLSTRGCQFRDVAPCGGAAGDSEKRGQVNG